MWIHSITALLVAMALLATPTVNAAERKCEFDHFVHVNVMVAFTEKALKHIAKEEHCDHLRAHPCEQHMEHYITHRVDETNDALKNACVPYQIRVVKTVGPLMAKDFDETAWHQRFVHEAFATNSKNILRSEDMKEYGADAKILFHHHSSDFGGGTQAGSTLTVPLQMRIDCDRDILLDSKELYELPNVIGRFLGANSGGAASSSSSGISDSDCGEVYGSHRTIMSDPKNVDDLCKPRVLEYSASCAEEMRFGLSLSRRNDETENAPTPNATMLDCSDERNKSSTECICRDATNWDKNICQEAITSGRIIGGHVVGRYVYPWFALDFYGSSLLSNCGGSLVSPEYVLTAAHCVADKINQMQNNGGYRIGALCHPFGPSWYSNCGQKVEKFGIRKIYVHPYYNPYWNNDNDFALVRLDGASSIAPVAMDEGNISPGYENLPFKANLWAAGFGRTGSGLPSTKLMHTNLNYVKQYNCKQYWAITGNIMCAKSYQQDSPCSGDSGGPLFDGDSNRLVGVVSGGHKFCIPGYPSYYARISNQIYWIKKTICSNHGSPKPGFCGRGFSGESGHSIIIDFDENGYIAAPYYRSDIQLHNFWSMNASMYYCGHGFIYGTVSGPNVGFNGFAKPMDISCPDGSFNLNSLRMTPAYHNDLRVDIHGYLNRSLKATFTTTLSSTTQQIKLESELSNFTNIDYISITTTPPSQVAVDDIAIEIISLCTVQPQDDDDAASLLYTPGHRTDEKLSNSESEKCDLAAIDGAKWSGKSKIIGGREGNHGGRIIDGEEVGRDVYPWFARATEDSSWAGCGGSLVSPKYVLTAAHCVHGRTDRLISHGGYQIGALCAPYGPSESDNCGQKVESFGIDDIIVHPKYNSDETDIDYLDNDFALVRLDAASTITPVRMDQGGISPGFDNMSMKSNLWPAGIGKMESGEVSDRLMHVNLNYVKQDTCKSKYALSWGSITDNMMCAADEGQDSCNGDSGGPLYDSDSETLVGIVSWGPRDCANVRYPGVYARVSSQYEWIKEIICEDTGYDEMRSKPLFCGSDGL